MSVIKIQCDLLYLAGGSLQYANKGSGAKKRVVRKCKYSMWTDSGWGAIMTKIDYNWLRLEA